MRRSKLHTLAFCVVLSAGLAGCSDDSSGVCAPNQTRSCSCPAGQQGTEQCNAAGTAWGQCGCGNADSGTPDIGVDSGRQDAGVDQAPPTPDTTTWDTTTTPDTAPPAPDIVLFDDGSTSDTTPSPDSTQLVDGMTPVPDTGPMADAGTSNVPLHGLCATPTACAAGLACRFFTGQPTICYQDCSTSPNVCAANTDGRTTCQAFGATTSLCVEIVPTSGVCDTAKSKICGPTDECNNGVCTPLPTGALFAACGPGTSTVCGTGQTCTLTSGALTNGNCFDNCNPATPTCTTATFAGQCVALSTPGAGVCVPNGTGAQDSVCGQEEGAAFDRAKECSSTGNLLCLVFDSNTTKGVCVPEVTSCTTPNACATGRTCLDLTGGSGACAESCTASAAVCTAAGKNCVQISATDSVCGPAGSKVFGDICSNTVLCAPDLTCLRATATSTQGFCTQDCGPTATCPTTPAGSACTPLSATDSLCIWPCGQPGQQCPTNLTCQSAGTSSFCLAP
jgi:hypothetical protein